MKTIKLMKSEIIEKIIKNDLSKKHLLLLSEYVDNMLRDNIVETITSFDDYLNELDYGDIMKPTIVFDGKYNIAFEIWDTHRDTKEILVKAYVIERFNLTNQEFLITLQKVITEKGSPRNILNYKVIVLED